MYVALYILALFVMFSPTTLPLIWHVRDRRRRHAARQEG